MEMSIEMGGSNGGVGLGLNTFDHDLGFEGDNLLDGISSIPFTPSYDLDTFSSTFDDPFSYNSTDFSLLNNTVNQESSNPTNNHSAPNDASSNNENTTGKPDNKLLSFGPVIPKCTIFTGNGGQTWPAMMAELYGMFFVAEDVFGESSIPPAGRPMELTCYRRNLFQISGSMTLSRGIKSFINEQGQQLPIYELSASLSAFESIEGKPTEIISVPWKTQGMTGSSDDTLPPKWPLDLSMNPELDPSVVSIPIAWKRLQFKHATANNGRRKGLQQHYVIQVNLHGTLGTGEVVKLAEIQSGPIIVRGRSPRNFDSRKDVTLGAAASGEKKLEPKPRTSSDASTSRDVPVKHDPGVSNGHYKFYALNALQQPLDLPDWNTPSTTAPLQSPSLPTHTEIHRAKKPALAHSSSSSSNPNRPPVPKTRWMPESTPSNSRSNTVHTAPIDLSIAEDDYGATGRSGSMGGRSFSIGDKSPQLERVGSGGSASTRRAVGSPVENADLLYEYFPLSLDDWAPPVDAIYRPHVVHHTIVPPDLKAEQVKNKTKRYFSAED